MKRAEELAIIHGEDPQIAKVVGIAHDIAKEMTKQQILEYVKENNIEIDEIERKNVGLLHGKIGADICKNEYNFTHKMQNAILFHTTGDPSMDLLAKIIYLADKTEENRIKEDFDVDKIRELANEDVNKAMVAMLDESIGLNIKRGKLIHPDSIYTRNYIIESTF